MPLVSGLVEAHLSLAPEDLQKRVAGLVSEYQTRITVIGQDGTVLADSARSWTEVESMDNHAERPEIDAARDRGQGSSTRRSATTGLLYVYAAKTVADKSGEIFVVRLAQPVQSLDALRWELALVMVAATAAALVAMTSWV